MADPASPIPLPEALEALESAPDLDALVRGWRQAMTPAARLPLAEGLWQSGRPQARIAAAKLVTQARIRPSDADVWERLMAWLPDLDPTVADAFSAAIQRRLAAEPARLDVVEGWTRDERAAVRRAALTGTLHLARLPHPHPAEVAARERVLGWAEALLADPDRGVQAAVGDWLRHLCRHDPARAQAFLDRHGEALAAATRRHLGQLP